MIGYIFTKNAPLLLEDVDHLQTRLGYLRSKKFSGAMVRSVLCDNPYWLTYTVEEIDARLGYFQKTLDLTGDEIRGLAVKLPKLITWGGAPGQVRTNLLVLKDQCGFKVTKRLSLLIIENVTF